MIVRPCWIPNEYRIIDKKRGNRVAKEVKTCAICGNQLSGRARRYCSRTCYKASLIGKCGKENNNNWKGGMAKCIDCGKELSQRNYSRCKSCSSKGELNPNYKIAPEKSSRWKGGISSLYKAVRNLFEYRQWRSDVFSRDKHTCQICHKSKSGRLEAHHIVRMFSLMLENKVETVEQAQECQHLWNINNGVTLCVDCHKIIHKTRRQHVNP